MDKKTVIHMLQNDFLRFHKESTEISKKIVDFKTEVRNYMGELITQISASGSGPLLAKTPKVSRKRGTRIKAIPESSEIDINSTASSNQSCQADTMILETSDPRPSRAKRGASIKAMDVIKKQSSVTLNTKLRRPSKENNEDLFTDEIFRQSRSKRPNESIINSEDEDVRPSKQMKIERKHQSRSKINDETHVINGTYTKTRASVKRKLEEPIEDDNATLIESSLQESSPVQEPVAKKANNSTAQKNQKDWKHLSTLERISEKSGSSTKSKLPDREKSGFSPKSKLPDRITRSSASLINAQSSARTKLGNIVNETMDISNPDETVASMYEDAIGKPLPIMNSTMNPNSTITLEKIMMPSVLLEPLPLKKVLNETVTIKKSLFKDPSSSNNAVRETADLNLHSSKINLNSNKEVENKNSNSRIPNIAKFNELITDDESSPERKISKVKKGKLTPNKRMTRSTQSLGTDEDEFIQTPVSKLPRKISKGLVKPSYKSAALFSPYAKESVKKKVEAFEQVAISPQHENENAGRVTRTKTRALAVAATSEAPTVTQKLARKSLAKAKKISLAKHARDNDDLKEHENINTKSVKKISNSSEKSMQKVQSKTTPLSKNRLGQLPGSANKFTTPSNTQTSNNYSKTLTASRGNIVTHVDSFIQSSKSASKPIDRVAEEKRRRAHEEDARRKREELLKAQAEEKRRKREEKELKNKLAREAKERLEQEKRKKAEQEREEKARIIQQNQEKKNEELERKRQIQMIRALEREERRKHEENSRQQREQEQEEQERLLAEQKRRDQEMERRKLAELKHQEMKLKNHALMQAKAKVMIQKHVPLTYKLDSDPDEDDSDDENKPKHEIPPWASKNFRQAQLTMQKHIPMKVVLRFFDAKKCTPDLRELFHGIDPKKLKRSSSAIWKTPPRYSMMNCSVIND